MKGKRKILIQTMGSFMLFYLISMGVITAVQQSHYREQAVNDIKEQMSQFGEGMHYSLSHYDNLMVNGDERLKAAQEGNYLAKFEDWLSRCIPNGSGRGVYARGALFSESRECLATSGNKLIYQYTVPLSLDNKDFGGWEVRGSVNLSEILRDDELIDLYSFANEAFNDKQGRENARDITLSLEGTVNYSKEKPEIIPTTLKVQQRIDSKIEVLKEYWLISEEIRESKLVELKVQELWFEREALPRMYSQGFSERSIERYNQCANVSDPIFFQKLNGELTLDEVEHHFFYTKYNRITPVYSDDAKFYINTSSVIYPWGVAIADLKIVYMVNFLIMFILAIVLWRKFNQVYEQQKKLEENRRRLTDGIAHEIKTPLGIIRSYSEGLKERIAEDKRDQYLDTIIDEVENIDKMVINMLEISKLESPVAVLKKEQFDLGELLVAAVETQRVLFEDREIIVDVKKDDKGSIEADFSLMSRVVNNLLINAVEHTPDGGKVIISLSNKLVTIENQGEPIPNEHLPHIWDSFYKVDSTRSRALGGTGLGLAIVKQILELHEMEFGVENTEVGVCFWFKAL